MPRLALIYALLLVLVAGTGLAHEDPAHQIADLDRHIREDPADADLYLQRGQLLRLEMKWDAAEADFQKAGDLGADTAVVALCRAALELDRGRPAAALEILGNTDGPRAWLLRGRSLHATGHHGEAAAFMARALVANPRPCPEDYLETAAVTAEQGNGYISTALDILDAGCARLGAVAPLILAAVDLELRRDDPEAALGRLDSASSLLNSTPTWLVRRGEVLLSAGRRFEAEAAFTEALALLEALPPHRRTVAANLDLQKKLRDHLSTPPGATP